jgi:hypothetical protein
MIRIRPTFSSYSHFVLDEERASHDAAGRISLAEIKDTVIVKSSDDNELLDLFTDRRVRSFFFHVTVFLLLLLSTRAVLLNSYFLGLAFERTFHGGRPHLYRCISLSFFELYFCH